jgi:solute carrier family 12 (potassium/chloride transporters), member 9
VPAWKQSYKLRVILFVEHPEDVEEEKSRVQQLLDNLRIDAILIVLCLSSTATYRCIINGDVDVNGRVEDILRDDQWWHDLKQLRKASSSSTPMAPNAFAQARRAFRSSLADGSPLLHRPELFTGPLARRTSISSTSRPSISLAPPRRRQSMAVLPQSFTMRMGVGNPGFFSHISSESSSSEDEIDDTLESDSESETDNAIASDESSENIDPLAKPDYFTSSTGTSRPAKSPFDELGPGKKGAFSASAHASLDVDDDDTPHVSFKSSPHPSLKRPQTTDLELSFNILPARAQYLILNDLIRSHSKDTAVVFTTLPAPAQGTYQDEEKSLEYVSGLELLCEDIPPVLLIHSNSLVVTLAL